MDKNAFSEAFKAKGIERSKDVETFLANMTGDQDGWVPSPLLLLLFLFLFMFMFLVLFLFPMKFAIFALWFKGPFLSQYHPSVQLVCADRRRQGLGPGAPI